MLLLSLLTNIPTIAACVTFKLIATEYRTQAAVSPCRHCPLSHAQFCLVSHLGCPIYTNTECNSQAFTFLNEKSEVKDPKPFLIFRQKTFSIQLTTVDGV